MNTQAKSKYKIEKAAFIREYSRIEVYKRRELTKKKELREDYKEQLINGYNRITQFLHEIFLANTGLEERIECQTKQRSHLTKLKEAFELIKVEYEFDKNIFALIDVTKVSENWASIENIADTSETDTNLDSESTKSASETQHESDDESLDNGLSVRKTLNKTQSLTDFSLIDAKQTDLNSTFSRSNPNLNTKINFQQCQHTESDIEPDIESDPEIETEPNHKMAFEYIANISRILKNEFDGDADKLDAFVTSIEICDAASEVAQQPTLVKFIRSKLIGTARHIVPENTANATAAINLLKAKIRGDNTEVVTGRLLALRMDRTSMQKFQ